MCSSDLGETNQQTIDMWFNTFCQWKLGGTWNYVGGKMRQLKRWTRQADELFSKWQHVKIPAEMKMLFHRSTRPISNNLQLLLERGLNMGDNFDESANGIGPDGFAIPDSDRDALYYYNTCKSPNRWYHPLQNLTTRQKKIVFKGHINVDIVS